MEQGGTSNPTIFRKQLKKLLEAAADEFEFCDLCGSMLSDVVRKDERGLANAALMRKVFGDEAATLHEHAITKYDADGRFFYERVDEGVQALEEQIRSGPIDVLLGFSQGGKSARMRIVDSARALTAMRASIRALPFRSAAAAWFSFLCCRIGSQHVHHRCGAGRRRAAWQRDRSAGPRPTRKRSARVAANELPDPLPAGNAAAAATSASGWRQHSLPEN